MMSLLVMGLACKPEEAASPSLAVSPEALDLGAVSLGEAATGEVTLTNEGGGEVTILSASIVEGDADVWSLDRAGFDALAAGDTVTLTLSFEPEEVVAYLASLQIRSDDPAHETAYVALMGEGTPSTADGDADGYSPADGDCDDGDAAVNPAAAEACDGEDTDCDGELPSDEADADGDGWHLCDADCDDGNASVYPGAPELCDDLDDDCDGATPDRDDADGDGYSICDGDCDDGEAEAIPGGAEVCDGADNDCSGVADDLDADADGFSPCDPVRDCDDDDADAHPVYVDDAGSENAAGTYADPYLTLELAWAAIDDTCRTIGVLDGVYAPALAVDGDLAVIGLGDVTLTPPAGERAFEITGGGLVQLVDVTITGAVNAEGDGGAIHVDGADLLLDGVTMSGNTAAADGGAIAVASGLLNLIGSTRLEDNTAGDDGGAVAIIAGELVDGGATTWSGNAARLGGALVAQSSDVQMHLATFEGNVAAEDGGAVYLEGTSFVEIQGSSFWLNEAAGTGGALSLVDVASPDGFVRNLWVSENVASEGGGLAVTGSASLLVANNTIVSNDGGDALHVDVTDGEAVWVWSNVVAFNDGAAGLGCAGGASVAYNLVYGTDSGTDYALGDCADDGENLVDDPLFRSFDDDGDPSDDDLTPGGSSPARDSGPSDGEGPEGYVWSDTSGSRNDRGHTGGQGSW
ncbi:MAG: MopE-related protein [Myxococcota bacterium]